MVKKLLPLVPDHKIYVEVFGGGASLLVAKDPEISKVEVYNDLDGRLVNLFRVLRDPVQFAEFERMAAMTAFAREEFLHCRDLVSENSVESAWAFFVKHRQGFSGLGKSWGYCRSSTARGMAAQTSKWIGAIAGLVELHERLMRVQIDNDDWRKILTRYDSPETFFYLDPPYIAATRKSGGYSCELGDKDHAELVERVQKLEGKVLLSGYPNGLYANLTERAWSSRSWEVCCAAAGRTRTNGILGAGSGKQKQPRTEAVWMNYEVG